jgi:hypothetical protein
MPIFNYRNPIFNIVAAPVLCLMLTQGVNAGDPTVSKADQEARQYQAAEVLRSRGFVDQTIYDLVWFWSDKRNDDAFEGHESYTTLSNMRYDTETGLLIEHRNPLNFARTISTCVASGNPWRDCELNYHPVGGCFLEGEVGEKFKRASGIMSKYGSGTDEFNDAQFRGGWNYEKGPGLMLPDSVQMESQIDLANAVPVKKQVLTKSSISNTAGRVNPLNRPACFSAGTSGKFRAYAPSGEELSGQLLEDFVKAHH